MNPIKISPNVYLIPLNQDLPGFHRFIGAWLYKGDATLLIDVGPAHTVPMLARALDALEVKRLDAVLLTHIHIDHAGGVGDFIQRFPDTPVAVHASGIRHMADPTRLWEGSLKTLGDTARAYGPIGPVPSHLLTDAAEFRNFGVEPILTPGHAPHHVSYLKDNLLFAGETGGVFIDRTISNSEDVYLRPATPPRFFLETQLASLETLINTPHDLLCYGHFGATTDTPGLLHAHKRQLHTWAGIIENCMETDSGPERVERCLEALLESDPLMAPWNRLKPDVQQREMGFLHNSIRGFIGYFTDKKNTD